MKVSQFPKFPFDLTIIDVYFLCPEEVVQRCSVKKVFLEISKNSQENTCPRVSFLIKLQARPATLLKKRLWHRCFPVNFARFLRIPFLQNTSGRLLLYGANSSEAIEKIATD